MVDFNDTDTDEVVQLCHHCKDHGMISKLGPRQVKEQEEPGPDWDMFRQCATCGTIYGLYKVKKEQAVSGFAATSESPFESQKGIVMSIPKRNSKEGRKISERKQRERNMAHDEDPEIQIEIDRHGEQNVS